MLEKAPDSFITSTPLTYVVTQSNIKRTKFCETTSSNDTIYSLVLFRTSFSLSVLHLLFCAGKSFWTREWESCTATLREEDAGNVSHSQFKYSCCSTKSLNVAKRARETMQWLNEGWRFAIIIVTYIFFFSHPLLHTFSSLLFFTTFMFSIVCATFFHILHKRRNAHTIDVNWAFYVL